MLGLLLLLIAIILYFQPKYRYISYFLYLSFMMGYSGGFGLWTDSVLKIQNKDIAIVYTFAINIYLIASGKFHLPHLPWINYYKLLVLFIIACVLFSLIYYDFSPYQVLQGGRSYLLLASLPILVQIKHSELYKLLRLLILVTVLTSCLYILQIVLGRPIMPYAGEGSIDPTVGLIRLYNSPANLSFYLTLSFIAPQYFKGKIIVYRILFFTALMCTLGRTGIFTSIMMVFLSLALTGKFSNVSKYAILIGLMLIPFWDTLSNRFEKGNTQNDLQQILRGDFGKSYESSNATMTYRFAWVYERGYYMIHRSLCEQIFGLGLISESQKRTHQLYHFNIGLYNGETGHINQLSTPDIAYGNLLVNLGFAGLFIYIAFFVHLIVFFFKNRKIHPIYTVCSAATIIMLISSFSGSAFSQPQTFSLYFIFIPIYLSIKKKYQQQHESNSHRIRSGQSNALLLRVFGHAGSKSGR